MNDTLTHKVRYHWRVRQEYDRDATALILIRYEWDEDGNMDGWGQVKTLNGESWVLTVDGWQEFSGYDTISDNIPRITGTDMFNQREVINVLDEFETHIRNAIAATGADI